MMVGIDRQSAIIATAELLVRRRRLFLCLESLLPNSLAIHGSWFSSVCTRSEDKPNLTVKLFDFITKLQIGLKILVLRSRKVIVNHGGFELFLQG